LSKIVLGVQDCPGPVDSLALLFEQSCPAIQFFGTGSSEEALAFLQDATAAGVTPELVLVDMHSLGIRGLQVLTALRAGESSWRIPVVMLTPDPLQSHKANCVSTVFTRYIVGPATPDGLMNAVKSVCALLGLSTHARSAGAQ
jgi:CheY-like chemotaxis protein